MQIFDLKLFNWHSDTQKLTVEISTLQLQKLERCFAIKNHETGNIERFEYLFVRKNEDDDVMFWTYMPVSSTSKVKQVVIFND